MRRAGALAAIALLLAGAFGLGLVLTRGAEATREALQGAPTPRVWSAPSLLDEIRRELARGFYRPVPKETLAAESIPELLGALDDPHTAYLTAGEYATIRNRTARSYSGVGLTVGPAKEGLIVTSALAGPARQAGIEPGDIIIAIDGRRAEHLPFERSLALIKGERGTVVHLTVKRTSAKGTMDFTVVRQEIAVPAIRSRTIKVRQRMLGYIRVLSFPASAAGRIDAETRSLVERGAEGLILDLRDNPGGLLGQAVQIASLFLAGGEVLSVAGEHQEHRVYEATGRPSHPELPLVVLVNGGSASASEILAAALADQGRAVVAGERTYGKTSVQSIRELSNGAALKLTTATYLTPAGADLTGTGFEPAVEAIDDPHTKPDEAVVAAEHALLELIEPSN